MGWPKKKQKWLGLRRRWSTCSKTRNEFQRLTLSSTSTFSSLFLFLVSSSSSTTTSSSSSFVIITMSSSSSPCSSFVFAFFFSCFFCFFFLLGRHRFRRRRRPTPPVQRDARSTRSGAASFRQWPVSWNTIARRSTPSPRPGKPSKTQYNLAKKNPVYPVKLSATR